VSLFRRRCKECGESPGPKVAAHLQGQAGTSEVEFTDFPYQACACGRLARWAFDPGLDFSEQLFDGGVATAQGRRGASECCRCGAELGEKSTVVLTASAHLNGFAPIAMRAQLLGYRCPACGLEQAPPGEFDVGTRPSAHSTDSGKALEEAVRSIGLSP